MKAKKIICAVLAAVIFLVLGAGCAYNPSVVMTVNDTEVTAGVYLFYQYSAAQEAYSLYLENSGEEYLSSVAFIEGKDLELEGVPVHDWIDNKTQQLIKDHVFIENEFTRLDLSFTSSDKSYNDQICQYQWEQLASVLQKNGVNYDSFCIAAENSFKKSAVLKALYEKGGEREFSEEDYIDYFLENYTRVDYLIFPTTNIVTGEPLSEEDLEKITELAQQMVDDANEFRGGLETAYFERYAEILELTGDAETELSAEHFATVAIIDTILNSTNTTLHEDFVAEVFEVEEEDTEYKYFYDEELSVIIAYRVLGLNEDDEYTTYEAVIRTALAEEPFEEYIKNATASLTVDIDKRAKKYYSINNIRFS